MDGLTPIVLGRCSLCGFSRSLGLSEIGGGVPCDHLNRGCCGTLDVAYRGLKRSLPAEFVDFTCTCDAPALQLHVSTMGGSSWTVGADPSWRVKDAKGKLQHASGVPSREQRLLHGAAVLADSELLRQYVGEGSSSLDFTLVKRQPDQALWREKVEESPEALRSAPEDMLADAEVVAAAARQDASMYLLAAPSLFEDAGFVYEAIRRRQGPQASEIGEGPLDWIRLPADAKLALRAAFHLRCQPLVARVLGLRVVSKASDEERLLLVVEPAICVLGDEEAAGALLQGLPRDVATKALQRSSLEHLGLGLKLLELVRAAPATAGIGRQLGRLLGGGGSRLPIKDVVLEPADYALSLFLRHADALRSSDSAEPFRRLLPHLQGIEPPGREPWRLLVETCAAHNEAAAAQQFFVAGGDDSQESASLLVRTAIPLTAIGSLRGGTTAKSGLLSKVLALIGGPPEVLAAVAQNRSSLRALVTAEEESGLGRVPELAAALRLACERGEEASGHVLLRAFVAPAPQQLPDFDVPLPWLQALRGLRGCDVVAIGKVLDALEAAVGDPGLDGLIRQHWTAVQWSAATHDQLSRALRFLAGVGTQEQLAAAELGGRAGRELQLATEGRLAAALAALPLAGIRDPAALCLPGLPPQAVALQAIQRASQAEERAEAAEQAVQRLRGELAEARRAAADEARRLKEELGQLRQRANTLEARVHAQNVAIAPK